MIVAFALVVAAVLLFWDALIERLRELAESPWAKDIEARHLVGAAVLAVAAWYGLSARSPAGPAPSPAPVAPGGLSLAGLFRGATAADDAATLAALCDQLASCVELDGRLPAPRLRSGVAVNELRVAAREGRLAGGSIGDRQPAVRDAIHQYMDRDDVLGPAGGPLDAAQRARWVAAFRAIARASEAAYR
jgi:hypothetical protein